jgi:hypothetical protein
MDLIKTKKAHSSPFEKEQAFQINLRSASASAYLSTS